MLGAKLQPIARRLFSRSKPMGAGHGSRNGAQRMAVMSAHDRRRADAGRGRHRLFLPRARRARAAAGRSRRSRRSDRARRSASSGPCARRGRASTGRISSRSSARPICRRCRRRLVEFVDWTAHWTLRAARPRVAHGAHDDAARPPPDAPRIGVRLGGPPPERLTPARRRVLDAAAQRSRPAPC